MIYVLGCFPVKKEAQDTINSNIFDRAVAGR